MLVPLNRLSTKLGFGSLCLAALTAVVFAYWPADGVVIGKDCKPDGYPAHIKALTQGDRFWANQVDNIDEGERLKARRLSAIASFNSKVEESVKRANKTVEDLYAKRPELRPTAAAQAAESLRERADAIEHAELQVLMDRLSAERSTVLAACRQKIVEALKR